MSIEERLSVTTYVVATFSHRVQLELGCDHSSASRSPLSQPL
jgi:hypothetical protein